MEYRRVFGVFAQALQDLGRLFLAPLEIVGQGGRGLLVLFCQGQQLCRQNRGPVGVFLPHRVQHGAADLRFVAKIDIAFDALCRSGLLAQGEVRGAHKEIVRPILARRMLPGDIELSQDLFRRRSIFQPVAHTLLGDLQPVGILLQHRTPYRVELLKAPPACLGISGVQCGPAAEKPIGGIDAEIWLQGLQHPQAFPWFGFLNGLVERIHVLLDQSVFIRQPILTQQVP